MTRSRVSPFSELLLLRLRDNRWSSGLERRLETIQPCGIVVSPEALRSPGQAADLLRRIARSLRNPPLLALAEEGGSVNPLGAFLSPLPSPRAVARGGPAAVRRQGELIGAALRALGFNLNFAPRLDLSNSDVQPALDTQTFGTDPRFVADCGRAFIEGLRQHKVFACAKHFPGLGVTHSWKDRLPLVDKPMAQLWREDLLPFRNLLPELPFVKLSNAVYKAYDFDAGVPDAMSENVANGLLRVKLDFRGIAVTDFFALLKEMSQQTQADQEGVISLEVFVRSLNAGCELHGVAWGEEIFLQEMEKTLERGTLSEDRVKAALENVRAVKKGLKRPSGKLSSRAFDRLTREFEKFSREFSAGE